MAALANSCNTYFLELSADLNRPALERICLSYDLTPPERNDGPACLIGLGKGWCQTPLQVARSFFELARNSHDSDVRIVLQGMAQCARTGTAKAVNMPCYAKTGTARCTHQSGLGDGYALAMFPLDEPRHVLLIGQHNTTGANAAKNVRLLAQMTE